MAGWVRMAIVASAVALGVAPCPPAAAQQRGGSITYASAGEIASLDPHVSGSLVELEMIHHLFEGLVAMDEAYNARPMLAAAVEIAPDARRFRFVLRQGVKFHNGDTVTSADVLASFQRYARVSNNAAILDEVASYDTPDPQSFVVNLKSTNAVFLDLLKSPTYPLAILPSSQKERPGQEIEVIGTGPFTLDAWEKESHLQLRRNELYSADRSAKGPDGLAGRKTVYIDTLRCRFIPDARQRLSALKSHEVDVAANLAPDHARRIEAQGGLVVQTVFPYCQQVFVTHASNGITANPLVRQAIQAAVGVDDIIGAVGPMARRNPSLTYPGSPYASDAAAPFYDRRDPERARALLKQAGYRGEKLVLQTNPAFSYMRDAILVLAQQLREVGMTTEVQVVDWLTNSTNLRRGTGNWHVTTTGYCIQPLLGPQQWRPVFQRVTPIDARAKLDAAYDTYFASADLAQRQAAWRGIEAGMLEQGYLTKVADLGVVRGNAARVQGLTAWFFPRFWNTWVN
jgi:peptide/nickel transport system substrate-binding protein